MKYERTDFTSIARLLLLVIASALPVFAQNVQVNVGKHPTAIPEVCVAVTQASLEGSVDVPALAKEAICKGAGDMMIEYSYVLEIVDRQKDKKGKTKETTTTYEVFIPTLKSGLRTKGVLVVTSRNGVAVPPDELEKQRLRAAERIGKEEEKIARQPSPPPGKDSSSEGKSSPVTGPAGMLPLGMYARSAINRSSLGLNHRTAVLHVGTFLATCQLTLLRREARDGRDTLVFKFTPRPDAQYGEGDS